MNLDFVYFEVSASAPYQIRKIEELNKTSTGAVEAKVVCFYRRRDLSVNLVQLADKHQKDLSTTTDNSTHSDIPQIRHRELFLSRQLETLPATHIRGKCTVTLHNDTESCSTYLSKDDSFFFQLVYDPVQKTLQADRGTMREGPEYQADVPPYKPPPKDSEEEDKHREELRWMPNSNLTPSEIDSYLLLTRSLGTLGRAYYPASSLRQPTVAMSAAAAGRDSTLQFALDTLHSANYDVSRALQALTPDGQPVVKLDEMESWSASEGNLFEEALEKYGKCFYDIQSDFLPWKHPKSLIEFYYMWKTTDHYIQQKRLKAAEAEHHLKQVYIPNYNKPNPAVLYPASAEHQPSNCEGCKATSSSQWYALGPATSPLKVCIDCWNYWKRYGDLKSASILDRMNDATSALPASDVKKADTSMQSGISTTSLITLNRHSISAPQSSVDSPLSGRVRSNISFQFVASPVLRLSRRLRPGPAGPRKQARQPFKRLHSLSTLQSEVQSILPTMDANTLQRYKQQLQARLANRDPKFQAVMLESLLTQLFPASRGAKKLQTEDVDSNAKRPIGAKQSTINTLKLLIPFLSLSPKHSYKTMDGLGPHLRFSKNCIAYCVQVPIDIVRCDWSVRKRMSACHTPTLEGFGYSHRTATSPFVFNGILAILWKTVDDEPALIHFKDDTLNIYIVQHDKNTAGRHPTTKPVPGEPPVIVNGLPEVVENGSRKRQTPPVNPAELNNHAFGNHNTVPQSCTTPIDLEFSKLVFVLWKRNVRTLKQTEQQAALALTLDSLCIDVCSVSETGIQDASAVVELTAPSLSTRFRTRSSGDLEATAAKCARVGAYLSHRVEGSLLGWTPVGSSDQNAITASLHNVWSFDCGMALRPSLKQWISNATVKLRESRKIFPPVPSINPPIKLIRRQLKLNVDRGTWWPRKDKELEEAKFTGNARKLFRGFGYILAPKNLVRYLLIAIDWHRVTQHTIDFLGYSYGTGCHSPPNFLSLLSGTPSSSRTLAQCPWWNLAYYTCHPVIITIIDSMTSVFSTSASLPCNHDLFEILIVKQRMSPILLNMLFRGFITATCRKHPTAESHPRPPCLIVIDSIHRKPLYLIPCFSFHHTVIVMNPNIGGRYRLRSDVALFGPDTIVTHAQFCIRVWYMYFSIAIPTSLLDQAYASEVPMPNFRTPSAQPSPAKKPQHTAGTTNHHISEAVVVSEPQVRGSLATGPRRRIGMGPDENGATTLMFLATDRTKIVALHRAVDRRMHNTQETGDVHAHRFITPTSEAPTIKCAKAKNATIDQAFMFRCVDSGGLTCEVRIEPLCSIGRNTRVIFSTYAQARRQALVGPLAFLQHTIIVIPPMQAHRLAIHSSSAVNSHSNTHLHHRSHTFRLDYVTTFRQSQLYRIGLNKRSRGDFHNVEGQLVMYQQTLGALSGRTAVASVVNRSQTLPNSKATFGTVFGEFQKIKCRSSMLNGIRSEWNMKSGTFPVLQSPEGSIRRGRAGSEHGLLSRQLVPPRVLAQLSEFGSRIPPGGSFVLSEMNYGILCAAERCLSIHLSMYFENVDDDCHSVALGLCRTFGANLIQDGSHRMFTLVNFKRYFYSYQVRSQSNFECNYLSDVLFSFRSVMSLTDGNGFSEMGNITKISSINPHLFDEYHTEWLILLVVLVHYHRQWLIAIRRPEEVQNDYIPQCEISWIENVQYNHNIYFNAFTYPVLQQPFRVLCTYNVGNDPYTYLMSINANMSTLDTFMNSSFIAHHVYHFRRQRPTSGLNSQTAVLMPPIDYLSKLVDNSFHNGCSVLQSN
ncbi:metastasis-associated protein MTA3 [Clonorchis sinensis]|uniref:Metastasis-associated protein MTA3 n=1 Tax=Clonorchis sinensis TaxID=79923 RepID=G7Y7K5_CLOSI|nr:metastasis-associated protein MTA3 [Clonorchis sinensis]